MKQFDIPLLSKFYGWPTILIIIGAALLFHSIQSRDTHNIFTGVIVFGIGSHFHGLHNYPSWSDHWAVYIFIVGLAFIIRSVWTREGIITGLALTLIASIFIFSLSLPQWLAFPFKHIHMFWPIAIILLGVYLLRKK